MLGKDLSASCRPRRTAGVRRTLNGTLATRPKLSVARPSVATMICKRCGDYVAFVTYANARTQLCDDCKSTPTNEESADG